MLRPLFCFSAQRKGEDRVPRGVVSMVLWSALMAQVKIPPAPRGSISKESNFKGLGSSGKLKSWEESEIFGQL